MYFKPAPLKQTSLELNVAGSSNHLQLNVKSFYFIDMLQIESQTSKLMEHILTLVIDYDFWIVE